MDFNINQNIDIDLYAQKYIAIKAKQYDNSARFVTFSCYNSGKFFPMNDSHISVCLRYKKPDNNGVLNKCTITNDGKILVEFTEQMLACAGRCEADLMIIDSVDITITTDGRIIGLDSNKVVSTMKFYVDVIPSPLSDADIESTYEFQALTESLEKVEQYFYIIKDLKKAVEEIVVSTDEAKEYANQAKGYKDEAVVAQDNAKESEEKSEQYKNEIEGSKAIATEKASEALSSANSAQSSKESAATSENNALTYKNDSNNYAILSQSYAVGGTNSRTDEDTDNSKYYYDQIKILNNTVQTNADNVQANVDSIKDSEKNIHDDCITVTQTFNSIQSIKSDIDVIKANIDISETNTKTSETNAKESETNAKASEDNIKGWETKASEYNVSTENYYKSTRSYAVGDIGYRVNEEVDNAKYYYEKAKEISLGLAGTLLPMGTITYENLVNQPKVSGYMYNISNEFTTDSTFKDGSGYKYPAGTNVYYTSDGYWDCLAGISNLVISDIEEIKNSIKDILDSIEEINNNFEWIEDEQQNGGEN